MWSSPNTASPTPPAATGFNYEVRTNEFAAVNAYYHVDEFFAELDSLGFDPATYFGTTTWPLRVDHRGLGGDGNTINAHCVGNGAGGTDHVCYGLNDLTDVVHPVGRACNSRVTWHELGAHGALYAHVDSPNFGFTHGPGDALSAIRHDPDSHAPDRFLYCPWRPIRRWDRSGAAWAWGGANDDHSYQSGEILATTLFRVYRSIGGNSSDFARRRFASRLMLFLIFHTIEFFTEATNPDGADHFAEAMMLADTDNWTTEGVYGGAYSKVVRWSFEKQGLYGGQPPAVDVYIEDGRGGEYTYQNIHWENPSIWNRRNPDGGATHQPPVPGVANYAYVKIKNRGTQQAHNVRVRGYHSKPMAGVCWPNDLQPFTTAEIAVGILNPNNTQEKTVGPFTWTPNANYWGHDCMMMIVLADGDGSNIDNVIAGEYIPDWRLVPNDNNIGQRNVVFAPIMHPKSLLEWLHKHKFLIGNPNVKPATVELKVKLPNVLASRGWRLNFEGIKRNRFDLESQEEREIVLVMKSGKAFDKATLLKARSRDIRILAYADGLLIGGMTYRLMPELA